ncbi:MAG TPA: hypothetical protein PLT82_05590 [Candidatus Hydrogenedens sp.]|nr:hypothetical protein [Candidatus Hydrogenedens sp.]HOL21156.1 hypothetical protein [Candidatus Hydrogenedens sp.]HPP58586.1 hypothetical protein [Candidatus Hydrogenedens sp.]
MTNRGLLIFLIGFLILNVSSNSAENANFLDISRFKVYLACEPVNEVQEIVISMLIEEIAQRTGIKLKRENTFDKNGNYIILTMKDYLKHSGLRQYVNGYSYDEIEQQLRSEGFAIFTKESSKQPQNVWIIGNDNRGLLYGVGKLLRILRYSQGFLSISVPIQIVTSPISPIRGHQLGYRAQANSYDAWDLAQYEKYIRELTFFGVNSIENIPFQDNRPSPHFRLSRDEINKGLSQICKKYGLDYWVWTPADFDLRDETKKADLISKHEALYRDCPVLTGVFFPGGDPGDNPPELVLPFLEELSKRLMPLHPEAKIWLSLQGFSLEQARYVFNYLKDEKPKWLGGLCEGPSSPPIAYLRQNLPAEYKLRMYPDITHNKLCQYPVPWWDIAFASVLGREAINPRPVQYAYIHNWFQPYCDGFISYSDGIHDDVNKIIWSVLSWDPEQNVRDILIEYANVFFATDVAVASADGILALERNWRGSVVDNGGIEGTLKLWQELEQQSPQLKENWRWQMCLVRAYYDAYIRRKLIYEQELEHKANQVLCNSNKLGSEHTIQEVLAILNRGVTESIAQDLKDKVIMLYDQLFHSIGLQSSVEKYGASGGERGASLDYIDIPLNNRWWLEDRLSEIQKLSNENEKITRLKELGTWEEPGYGSFYDDIGNTAKSPHVRRCEAPYTNPAEEAWPEPTLWWFDNGKSRKRTSWLSSLDKGEVLYQGLEPNGEYVLRISGYGKPQIVIDGKKISDSGEGMKELGELKEYVVPKECVSDREITIRWSLPPEDLRKNWRQQSRICEMWLLKQLN